MQSLPDNVIREVFELCRVDNIIPSILTPDVSPILLTHVSRRWKKIALSTPKIWSSISIAFRQGDRRFSEDSPQNLQHLQERALEDTNAMRRWLNSATCPLSIQFASCSQSAFEPVRQFFQFLIEISPRWQRLYFTFTHDQPEEMPLEFTQVLLSISLPLLKTLEFGDFALFIRPNSLFLRGLHLREISYLCSTRDWSFECPNQLSHLNIRWSHLTSLKLSCGTSCHPLNDYFTVLRRCSSLIYCSITEEHYRSRTSPMEDLAPVLLPHLRTLSLRLSPEAIQTCFGIIIASALENLSFQWNTHHAHTPDSLSPSLFSFLSMSGLAGKNKIQRLQVDPIQFTKPTFYQLLQSFPALKELTCRTDFNRKTQTFIRPLNINGERSSYSDSYIDDDFLRKLSGTSIFPQPTTGTPGPRDAPGSTRLPPVEFGDNVPVLLPHLTKFTCLTQTLFSEEALYSFVRARRPAVPASLSVPGNTPLFARTSATTPATILRYIAFAECQNGHLGGSDLLRASSVKRRLRSFEDDGLIVDICKYSNVDPEPRSTVGTF